ncbi:hypothetical protein ACFVWG_20670 [Kribbella sp. NPDC058245]|uniref:hypothetical protein n=1 Tax=Kribbella sp. NPDC058245 TaxID=3346399 RepID=UPI0036E89FE2
MAMLTHPSRRQQDVDRDFVERYLGEPHRTRVANLLRNRERALVIRQALLKFTKYALLFCESRGVPGTDDDDRQAAFAYLCVLTGLGPQSDLSDDDLKLDGGPGPLGRELIANQIFNSTRDLRGIWATFERCWRELPRELADNPRMLDLPSEYESATGVALDDLVAVCGALWASAGNGTSTIAPDYFDSLGWSEHRLHQVLSLISADRATLQGALSSPAEQEGLEWSTRTFEQYPVVRWPSGHLTVMNSDLVVGRASGKWPLFDILRCLESSGNRKLTGAVRTAVALSFETWVLEGFDSIVAHSPERFYSEERLKAAYPSTKVADAAVDYGDTWIVIEVTTAGIQAATASGISDDAVLTDINDCIKKARQLDATINNLRNKEERLTGTAAPVRRRFRPILVIADRFATGPIFTNLLWDRLKDTGVLQGDDVAPLEVMEIEDVHMIEGLVEQTGQALTDLLTGKEGSSLHAMSMREYLLLDRRVNPRPPQRVMTRWSLWADTAIQHLRRADDGSA